jgi:hypothetical protein
MAIGQRPVAGFELVDGEWLRQLANGNNYSFQSGIVAHAGGTQAAAVALSNNPALIQVDTVATTGDSVSLPFAAAGKSLSIFNNGAQTLDIYASPNTNPLTGTTDVINKTTNVTAYTLTTGQTADFWSAKNGTWAAQKSA